MRINGLIRKFTAGLMVAAMIFPIMPTRAVHAEEIDTTSSKITEADGVLATASDGTAEPERYSVTPNIDTVTFQSNKGLEGWLDRKSYKAPENTYCITVATGASKGDGVLYFAIKYKDSNNVSNKQFVFPNTDATARTDSLLKYYGSKDLDKTFGMSLASSLNYKDSPKAVAPLNSYSVQTYAFTTKSDISSVEYIDIYLERGSWTTQGLAIYKVNEYKGFEEYGIISGQQFFDFEGYLVAEIQKRNKSDQLSLSTSGSDKVFSIGRSYNKATIKNYPKDTAKKTFAGEESMYTFRLDFADAEKSGLDCFMNPESLPMKSANMGIGEDIALEFQYLDTHGWNRKVVLPVLLSSYGEAMKANPDEVIFGFGLRGDTIAFQGLFPEYESINGETKILVGDKARAELAKYGVSAVSKGKMANNLSESASDDIGISGLSFYKGGCMAYVPDGTDNKGNKVEGATLNYVFQNEGPLSYYTLMAERGRDIKAGGSDSISMKPYTKGNAVVASQTAGDKYLVTVDTNDSELAGTVDDVTVRFHYVTFDDDTDLRTNQYHIKDEAARFMSKWPTTDNKDFILESGLVRGGRLSFVITAADVRDFTGVEINIAGEDEWIIDNMTIAYLQSYDKRYAYHVPTTQAGATSNYWLERDSVSSLMFSMRDFDPLIYDENGNVVTSTGETIKELIVDENGNPVLDDNGNPMYKEVEGMTYQGGYGGQFIKGNETYTISFNTGTDLDIRKTEYEDVRYSMSHDQTGVNWGFFKKRKTYEVGVKVAADDAADMGNGNAGSTNHFYFQLLFANGKSGYVLANQQITADGFRSDMTESFFISTNQDYGELRKIRIIPEEVSSDADPYDKLNIESISVTEDTKGGSYLTYMFDSVGWIDIDYHDEAEETSLRNRRARTQEELSHTFEVSGKESRVKILCEIPYMPWDGDYGQFEGTISCKVYYTHASNGKPDDIEFDVAKHMAQYMEVSAISVEGKTNPDEDNVGVDGSAYRINSKYMMKPYHTDRFLLPPIADLGSIDALEFNLKNMGTVSSQWVIGNVSLSQVYEDGPVLKNANDELVRNMTVKKLCTKDNPTDDSYVLPVGTPVPTKPIYFTNKIEWKTETWATPVTRLPESKDDKVNIFIYPTPGAKNDTGASVDVLKYKYFVPYSELMQTSQYNLTNITDGRGANVYCAKGLSTTDFVSPSEITIRCINKNMSFDHAVVQHVRDNTVMNTFTYDFFNATAIKAGLIANPVMDIDHIDQTKAKFALSFGPGTPNQQLVPEGRDVAVALRYTSTIDDGKTEYQTPYIFLTDQGYTEIQEGTFAELNFNVPFMKDVVSYSIAAYGALEGNVRGAAAEVYSLSKQTDPTKIEIDPVTMTEIPVQTKRSYASFADRYAVTDRLSTHKVTSTEMTGEGALMPVAMTFTTGEAVSTGESGTSSAVCMVCTYRDDAQVSKSEKFMDITNYIQDEQKTFETDSTKTIKMFLPEVNSKKQLLSMKILPYNPIEVPEGSEETPPDVTVLTDEEVANTESLTEQVLNSLDASWTISKLNIDFGFDKDGNIARDVNKTFTGLENGGVIRLSNITCSLSASITDSGSLAFTENTSNVVGKSNDIVSGTIKIVGSTAGFTVRAHEMNGDAGPDVTADTVKVDPKTMSFTFTAPVNDTGESILYKIEVIPNDAEDLKYTIMLTVKSDPKPVGTPTDAEETP